MIHTRTHTHTLTVLWPLNLYDVPKAVLLSWSGCWLWPAQCCIRATGSGLARGRLSKWWLIVGQVFRHHIQLQRSNRSYPVPQQIKDQRHICLLLASPRTCRNKHRHQTATHSVSIDYTPDVYFKQLELNFIKDSMVLCSDKPTRFSQSRYCQWSCHQGCGRRMRGYGVPPFLEQIICVFFTF